MIQIGGGESRLVKRLKDDRGIGSREEETKVRDKRECNTQEGVTEGEIDEGNIERRRENWNLIPTYLPKVRYLDRASESSKYQTQREPGTEVLQLVALRYLPTLGSTSQLSMGTAGHFLGQDSLARNVSFE